MALTAATYISDSVLFIRDYLDSNVTDPISSDRVGRERFVVTSYPQRAVNYPIISVRLNGTNIIQRLGQLSSGVWQLITIEVRVWARNEKERDEISQDVFNTLRTNQFGAGGSIEFELHDLGQTSAVNVDEDGEAGIKSRVYEYQYNR